MLFNIYIHTYQQSFARVALNPQPSTKPKQNKAVDEQRKQKKMNEHLQCNICRKDEGAPVSPLLPPLLFKHLRVKVHGEMLACKPCSHLISLWDEFASEAIPNLEILLQSPKHVEIVTLDKDVAVTSVQKEIVLGDSINCTDSSDVVCITPKTAFVDILDEETNDQMKQTTGNPSTAYHFDCELNKFDVDIDVIYVKTEPAKSHIPQNSRHEQSKPHFAASPHAAQTIAETSCNAAPQRCEKSEVSKHELSHSKFMPKFQCSLCNKFFLFLNSFKLHNKTAHKRQTVKEGLKKCPSCNIDILNKKFFSHFIVHHSQPKNNLYCCILCSKKFTQRTSIISHFKQHCRYACNICGKKMSSRLGLVEHEKVSHNNLILTCDVQPGQHDNKSVEHSKKLQETSINVPNHNNSNSTGLTDAYKSNKNCSLKQYTCHVCSKTILCKSKGILATHMWWHFNVHPRSNMSKRKNRLKLKHCQPVKKTSINNICQKVEKENQHYFIKYAKFECKHCHKKFNSRKDLFLHVKQKHLNATMTNQSQTLYFPCSYCEKMYSSLLGLHSHMKKYHSALLDTFNKENIERQMKMSGYNVLKLRCSICRNAYSTKHGLRIHISKMHSKRKQAAQNKSKKKKWTKVFKCDVCSKVCINNRSLQIHVTKRHKSKPSELDIKHSKSMRYNCNI